MSELLKYDNDQQRDIWDTVLNLTGKETLSPLGDYSPVFLPENKKKWTEAGFPCIRIA